MSIKIYNGFELHHKNSVDLLNKLKDSTRRIESLAIQKLKRWITERSVYLYDNQTLKDADNIDKVLVKVYMEYFDRIGEVERTNKRDRAIDFSFSLTIFPRTPKRSIGVVYTEHQDLFNAFLESEYLSDYSYWSNTDKPEELSETEWQKRRVEWDKSIDRVTYGRSGLTFTVVDTLHPSIDYNDFKEFLPSFEQRCKDASLDGCYQTYLDILTDDHGSIDEAIKNIGAGTLFFEFKDWMQNTEEGQTAYQAAVEYCKNNLKEDLCFEDL